MATIYIVSNYGTLHKHGETIILEDKDGLKTTIFPYKTEQLLILGRTNITSEALNLLMKYNVDTVFMGRNGKFNGKLAFQTGKNVFLRQKQFKSIENHEFSLKFAQSIVNGKLQNQLTMLYKTQRKEKNHEKLKDIIEKMKHNKDKIKNTDNIDSIRGHEGYGAKLFFEGFPYAIFPDWAKFNGRSMHPPKDNVNAVLSFLYTLILFRVDTAIESAGLDPYVGYLHTLDYGKRSLTYDLMEEYRTPIADRLTVTMFNKNILEWSDFAKVNFSKDSDDFPLSEGEKNEENTITSEKEGVLLTKKGIKKVIAQFEKKLEEDIFYKPLEKRISYRKLILEQAKHFKRVVNNEEANYLPLVIK
jgi:CRISPR-associated protein Cas1